MCVRISRQWRQAAATDKEPASRRSARYSSLHCQHRMPLQLERIANINAVILFGAKSHILFEKTCLNQLWTKGLNHVKPNPRCVGVKEIRIAALNKLIARVTRHIDHAF